MASINNCIHLAVALGFLTACSFGGQNIPTQPSSLKDNSSFKQMKTLGSQYIAFVDENVYEPVPVNLTKIGSIADQLTQLQKQITPPADNAICEASLEDFFGMVQYLNSKKEKPLAFANHEVDTLTNSLDYSIFSCESRLKIKKVNSHELADIFLAVDSLKRDEDFVEYEVFGVGSQPFNFGLGTPRVSKLKYEVNCQAKTERVVWVNYQDISSEPKPFAEELKQIHTEVCSS